MTAVQIAKSVGMWFVAGVVAGTALYCLREIAKKVAEVARNNWPIFTRAVGVAVVLVTVSVVVLTNL